MTDLGQILIIGQIVEHGEEVVDAEPPQEQHRGVIPNVKLLQIST